MTFYLQLLLLFFKMILLLYLRRPATLRGPCVRDVLGKLLTVHTAAGRASGWRGASGRAGAGRASGGQGPRAPPLLPWSEGGWAGVPAPAPGGLCEGGVKGMHHVPMPIPAVCQPWCTPWSKRRRRDFCVRDAQPSASTVTFGATDFTRAWEQSAWQAVGHAPHWVHAAVLHCPQLVGRSVPLACGHGRGGE